MGVEARDAAKHYTIHRATPLSSPHILKQRTTWLQMSVVPRLGDPGLLEVSGWKPEMELLAMTPFLLALTSGNALFSLDLTFLIRKMGRSIRCPINFPMVSKKLLSEIRKNSEKSKPTLARERTGSRHQADDPETGRLTRAGPFRN